MCVMPTFFAIMPGRGCCERSQPTVGGRPRSETRDGDHALQLRAHSSDAKGHSRDGGGGSHVRDLQRSEIGFKISGQKRPNLAEGIVSNKIQQVTIVGGGTAGWLAAAIMNRLLNAAPIGQRVEVVLIELPTVPIVGVGEGTLPSIPRMQRLV